MKLRKRILVGYGVALVLVGVVLIWAVVNLVKLGRATDAILRENYKSILAADKMIMAIERQDSATLLVMLDSMEEGLQQFRENENEFLQWLGRAKDNITIRGEAEILQLIETGYSSYLVSFSNLRERLWRDQGESTAFYHETVSQSFKKVRDACTNLRAINEDSMFESSRRAGGVALVAIWSTVTIGLLTVAAGIGFSLLVSKRLVRPIEQMIDATKALSEGRYDVWVTPGDVDELGQLAESFNAMADRLGMYHIFNVEQITAEKRRSDAVLRSIEEGVVVVDAEFRVINMNPPAGRILAVDPEAVAQKHFLEVVKNDRLFELIKQAAKSGQPPEIEEGKDILSLGNGGGTRHYMFDVTPVVSEDGKMLGVVLLLWDVTRLKEIDRMKSEFVMTASHELKTPVHSLGMSIELLLESATAKLTDKENQLLTAAREELQRLKSLISDLLDLSKIEAGKVALALNQVPVPVLARKAVEIFKAQAETRKVALDVQVPGDLPDVQADANKITWVLSNLISNALRYVNPGGYIRVSAEQMGRWIHVSVADNGEGIPAEYQSRIFDKFVQFNSEKSVGGTGLGLAICKELVRAHKGTIWVESVAGQGTTFTFSLPVAQPS